MTHRQLGEARSGGTPGPPGDPHQPCWPPPQGAWEGHRRGQEGHPGATMPSPVEVRDAHRICESKTKPTPPRPPAHLPGPEAEAFSRQGWGDGATAPQER